MDRYQHNNGVARNINETNENGNLQSRSRRSRNNDGRILGSVGHNAADVTVMMVAPNQCSSSSSSSSSFSSLTYDRQRHHGEYQQQQQQKEPPSSLSPLIQCSNHVGSVDNNKRRRVVKNPYHVGSVQQQQRCPEKYSYQPTSTRTPREQQQQQEKPALSVQMEPVQQYNHDLWQQQQQQQMTSDGSAGVAITAPGDAAMVQNRQKSTQNHFQQQQQQQQQKLGSSTNDLAHNQQQNQQQQKMPPMNQVNNQYEDQQHQQQQKPKQTQTRLKNPYQSSATSKANILPEKRLASVSTTATINPYTKKPNLVQENLQQQNISNSSSLAGLSSTSTSKTRNPYNTKNILSQEHIEASPLQEKRQHQPVSTLSVETTNLHVKNSLSQDNQEQKQRAVSYWCVEQAPTTGTNYSSLPVAPALPIAGSMDQYTKTNSSSTCSLSAGTTSPATITKLPATSNTDKTTLNTYATTSSSSASKQQYLKANPYISSHQQQRRKAEVTDYQDSNVENCHATSFDANERIHQKTKQSGTAAVGVHQPKKSSHPYHSSASMPMTTGATTSASSKNEMPRQQPQEHRNTQQQTKQATAAVSILNPYRNSSSKNSSLSGSSNVISSCGGANKNPYSNRNTSANNSTTQNNGISSGSSNGIHLETFAANGDNKSTGSSQSDSHPIQKQQQRQQQQQQQQQQHIQQQRSKTQTKPDHTIVNHNKNPYSSKFHKEVSMSNTAARAITPPPLPPQNTLTNTAKINMYQPNRKQNAAATPASADLATTTNAFATNSGQPLASSSTSSSYFDDDGGIDWSNFDPFQGPSASAAGGAGGGMSSSSLHCNTPHTSADIGSEENQIGVHASATETSSSVGHLKDGIDTQHHQQEEQQQKVMSTSLSSNQDKHRHEIKGYSGYHDQQEHQQQNGDKNHHHQNHNRIAVGSHQSTLNIQHQNQQQQRAQERQTNNENDFRINRAGGQSLKSSSSLETILNKSKDVGAPDGTANEDKKDEDAMFQDDNYNDGGIDWHAVPMYPPITTTVGVLGGSDSAAHPPLKQVSSATGAVPQANRRIGASSSCPTAMDIDSTAKPTTANQIHKTAEVHIDPEREKKKNHQSLVVGATKNAMSIASSSVLSATSQQIRPKPPLPKPLATQTQSAPLSKQKAAEVQITPPSNTVEAKHVSGKSTNDDTIRTKNAHIIDKRNEPSNENTYNKNGAAYDESIETSSSSIAKVDTNNNNNIAQNITKGKTQKSKSPPSLLPPLPRQLAYPPHRIKPQPLHSSSTTTQELIQYASLDSPLDNGWTLLPHQKLGITRALEMKRLVLAFDMGLGKTLIGCVWSKAFYLNFYDELKKTRDKKKEPKLEEEEIDLVDDEVIVIDDEEKENSNNKKEEEESTKEMKEEEKTEMRIFVISPVSLKKEWKRTAFEATGLRCVDDMDGDAGGKKNKKKKGSPKKKKTKNSPRKKGGKKNLLNETESGDTPTRSRKKGKGKAPAPARAGPDDTDDDYDVFEENDANGNDESSHSVPKDTTTTSPPPPLEIFSWAKIPKVIPKHVTKYVVICDEAHSMQSMTSARTANVLRLVQSHRCIGVLLLSGTPMKNGKPLNLFPLLKAVKHPFGDNQKAYEVYFCAGHEKRYGRGNGGERVVWDANGSSNLKSLHAHIASHVFHMTKDDCLELPGKTREYRKVPVSSRHEMMHVNAMNELAKCHNAFSEQFNNYNEPTKEALLGAFAKVRQVASFAKIDATVALAKSLLEVEPAIVIFTCFVTVAKDVHKKLEGSGWGGELLTGETPNQKRQVMVDNFQAGISPVFVCTFGAGGVGLTLTAASTIILLDRPWTPGDALQAEDRIRRIGQTKAVKSIWMRAFEVDEQIDDLIYRKKQNCHVVVNGKEDDLSPTLIASQSGNESKAAPKISIFQLVRSIISNSHDNARGLQKA